MSSWRRSLRSSRRSGARSRCRRVPDRAGRTLANLQASVRAATVTDRVTRPRTVVLASASPARLALLRAAGLSPVVLVSDVDEAALERDLAAHGRTAPAQVCEALAVAKAQAVATRLGPDHPDALVVAADSVLDLDGVALGKPRTADEAVRRWRAMAGRAGTLHTGHAVVDRRTGSAVRAVASTLVRFGRPDPVELAAYVASEEPLRVAGAFTLDGLGGAFVDGVEGDPSTVIGLSLPTLRALLADLGVRWTDLWQPR